MQKIPKVPKNKEPKYIRFLKEIWHHYKNAIFIPQSSFGETYTFEEGLRRFGKTNPHPRSTFDKMRALTNYFANINTDMLTFAKEIRILISPKNTKLEDTLTKYGMEDVSKVIKEKRIAQGLMTVNFLELDKYFKQAFSTLQLRLPDVSKLRASEFHAKFVEQISAKTSP